MAGVQTTSPRGALHPSESPVFKPGEKAPISGSYNCHRGTMLPPVRVQLTKGEEFPEAEGLGAHTRWRETNIQA